MIQIFQTKIFVKSLSLFNARFSVVYFAAWGITITRQANGKVHETFHHADLYIDGGNAIKIICIDVVHDIHA